MKSRRPGPGPLRIALPLLAASALLADAVGYRAIVNLREQTDVVVAEHHHDWSRATEAARFKMITTTRDPFTQENTYSYLRLLDRASGRELFKKPVPALTHLWISPDSRFVVGVSNVKLWNPYQIVVFDLKTWGWITLIWAVVIGLTGLGLLSGSSWARWTAIVLISINFLTQLGFAGSAAYPLWALTVQILNLVVLYALTVHWNGTREPAYASSSA